MIDLRVQITDTVPTVAQGSLEATATYNVCMARGWESKSVEAQQAGAIEEKQRPKARMSPERAALQRRIEGLALSRQHVLEQLATASDLRHRQILEHALADLDRQIQELQSD